MMDGHTDRRSWWYRHKKFEFSDVLCISVWNSSPELENICTALCTACPLIRKHELANQLKKKKEYKGIIKVLRKGEQAIKSAYRLPKTCLRHSTGSSLNPPRSTLKSRSGQRPFACLRRKFYWVVTVFVVLRTDVVYIDVCPVIDSPGSPLHTISKATAILIFRSSLRSSLQHTYLQQTKRIHPSSFQLSSEILKRNK